MAACAALIEVPHGAAIEARSGEWEDLGADSFKDEGIGVQLALITMQV